MFCRPRQRLHLEILQYVRRKNAQRYALQMTNDWTYDLWYMWLSDDPYKHASLIRDNYIDYVDFCHVFEFAESDEPPENYRISLWNTLKYIFRRPTTQAKSLPNIVATTIKRSFGSDEKTKNTCERESEKRNESEKLLGANIMSLEHACDRWEFVVKNENEKEEDGGLVHVMHAASLNKSSPTFTDDDDDDNTQEESEENTTNGKTADSVIDGAD